MLSSNALPSYPTRQKDFNTEGQYQWSEASPQQSNYIGQITIRIHNDFCEVIPDLHIKDGSILPAGDYEFRIWVDFFWLDQGYSIESVFPCFWHGWVTVGGGEDYENESTFEYDDTWCPDDIHDSAYVNIPRGTHIIKIYGSVTYDVYYLGVKHHPEHDYASTNSTAYFSTLKTPLYEIERPIPFPPHIISACRYRYFNFV